MQAVAQAEEAIATFSATFRRHWLAGMRAKLGLFTEEVEDIAMIEILLQWMQQHHADYTNTFRALKLGSGDEGLNSLCAHPVGELGVAKLGAPDALLLLFDPAAALHREANGPLDVLVWNRGVHAGMEEL